MVIPLTIQDVKFTEGKQPTLRLQSWSTDATGLLIQGFTKNGYFEFSHTPSSDRTISDEEFRLDDYPISFSVSATGSTYERGDCYVRTVLEVGGNVVGVLTQGYVSTHSSIFYPGGPNEDSLSGRGSIGLVSVSQPSAGADWEHEVPSGAVWKIHWIKFHLDTDGNAADRQIWLTINDGTNDVFYYLMPDTVAANEDFQFYLSPTNEETSSAVNSTVMARLPHPLILPAGYKIGSTTTNIQAGDQYDTIRIFAEEWKRS